MEKSEEKISIHSNSGFKATNVSKTMVANKMQEVVDVDFSMFVNDIAESIEVLKKTGGSYHRVWLLRHFPVKDQLYKEDDPKTAYTKLTQKRREDLTEDENKWIKKMDKCIHADTQDIYHQNIIKAICRKSADGREVPIYTDGDGIKIRNKDTLEWVNKLKNTIPQLANLSTNKEEDLWKSLFSTVEQLNPLFEKINEYGTDLVVLGNRTFAPEFSVRANRIFDSIKGTLASFEDRGYDFMDLDKNNKVVSSNKHILIITPENFSLVQKILEDICGDLALKTYFSECFAVLPLTTLQEAINIALGKMKETNPWNFTQFLMACVTSSAKSNKNASKKNLDFNMQWYALEQLISLGVTEKELCKFPWHKEIISRTTRDGYRRFILQYYSLQEEETLLDDRKLFYKETHSNWMMNRIFKDALYYQRICQYQRTGSVDTMIKKGEEGGILGRWAAFEWEKQSEDDEKSDDKQTKDFERILSTIYNTKYLLRANVGEWKSLWTTELAKYAMLQGIPVKFYRAKDLTLAMFEEEGEIMREYTNTKSKTLFFFDGIDEIMTDKPEIKQKISELSTRCFASARTSEYPENNTGFHTLSLDSIDPYKFIESRFSNKKETEAYQKFVDLFTIVGEEVRKSPIFLAMLVLLAEADDVIFQNNSAFSASIGEEIWISFIYENVIRLILSRHSKTLKDQNFDSERDLESWMDELTKYAYHFSKWKPQKTKSNYFDVHLSILFRSTNNGQYDFIHESFYDFFLARYFFKKNPKKFPHNIGRRAKEFYADMQEWKNDIFCDLARDYSSGFERIMNWEEKDARIIELYKKELQYYDYWNLLFLVREMDPTVMQEKWNLAMQEALVQEFINQRKDPHLRRGMSSWSSKDLRPYFIQAFTKNEDEPDVRNSLNYRIHDFEFIVKSQKDYARFMWFYHDTLFFSLFLLHEVRLDSAIRALPDYIFQRWYLVDQLHLLYKKNSSIDKEISSRISIIGNELRWELFSNIARIGTPYALSVLKEKFVVKEEYNSRAWLILFSEWIPAIKDWFLDQLDDFQKSEFFLLLSKENDKSRFKKYLLSYLREAFSCEESWISPEIYSNLLHLVEYSISLGWISFVTFWDDLGFLEWFLDLHCVHPFKEKELNILLEKAHTYLSSSQGQDINNNHTRRILCALAKMGDQMSINKIFDPLFSLRRSEILDVSTTHDAALHWKMVEMLGWNNEYSKILEKIIQQNRWKSVKEAFNNREKREDIPLDANILFDRICEIYANIEESPVPLG